MEGGVPRSIAYRQRSEPSAIRGDGRSAHCPTPRQTRCRTRQETYLPVWQFRASSTDPRIIAKMRFGAFFVRGSFCKIKLAFFMFFIKNTKKGCICQKKAVPLRRFCGACVIARVCERIKQNQILNSKYYDKKTIY